jgi:hypothetical protein
MKSKINFFFSLVLALLLSSPALAQSIQSTYIVQPGDWLSKISQKAYGTPHLYNRIQEVTNRKAKNDTTKSPITKIVNVNRLEEGQKIWIPGPTPPRPLLSKEPTNCEIRLWYNYQVVAIGMLNKKWIDEGLDLETRAHKAYELRHTARMDARYMMVDKAQVKDLEERDLEKYENEDGPTFKWLMEENMKDKIKNGTIVRKAMSREESWESIIEKSSYTDRKFNEECE